MFKLKQTVKEHLKKGENYLPVVLKMRSVKWLYNLLFACLTDNI